MKIPVALRKLYLNDLWLLCVLLAFMVLCYGVILRKVGVHLPLNQTFNSMLDHLVHWRFDVDPNIVGSEGFPRNGRVYSYWGITCAVVRLPLLFFHRLDLDVTAWSCLVAVCLAGMMKVRTVLFLRRYCGPTTASEGAFVLMLAYIVLGGAAVGYLKSSTYQEVVFWAIAFAAVFVYFAVKGLVSGQFTVVILSWMALAAGLATLTRVSTGMGLCAALGLLLLVLLLEELRAGRAVFTRRFLVPAMVLAAFLIVVGTVNYQRWGKPTTFADYSFYLSFHRDLLKMERSGLFNLARLPFGLSYYFLPLAALQGAHGLFDNTQTRLMFAAELPPSSFFLTDLLPIAFIVFLAMALWPARRIFPQRLRKGALFVRCTNPLQSSRIFSRAQGLALAAGLAVPCVLMLTAIYMSYRYRMEFYPEIDLLAFLGLYATVSNPDLLLRFNRCRRWMLAATLISILSAFAALTLYWFSIFGLSQRDLPNGLVDYYVHSLLPHFPKFLFGSVAAVLTLVIAGFLYLLHFERVDNLGA
jgi:hypothetical protein